jgi:hypothetical protein
MRKNNNNFTYHRVRAGDSISRMHTQHSNDFPKARNSFSQYSSGFFFSDNNDDDVIIVFY